MIRNAEEKDLPYIKNIMNDAVANTTAVYDYYERDDDYVKEWFKNRQVNAMPVLVCEADNVCVGYGSYARFRPKDGYKFCVEHSVYVDKNYTGKGFGSLLLNELIAAARRQNMHTMVAGIDAENKDSIAFHKKFGFEEAGFLKEVGYKFNRWLDLVFMEKIL